MIKDQKSILVTSDIPTDNVADIETGNFWTSPVARLSASDIQKFKILTFYIVILIFTFSFFNLLSFAAAPEELKTAINKKSQELQEISAKIKEAQQGLEEIQSQSRTLEREIKNLDYTINQLNLSIRFSEITIDKLNLEINALKYDIADAEQRIFSKKEAIVKILQEFQQKDGETPLIIFLKNKSLAESVFETQSLVNLNAGLSTEVDDLKETKNILTEKIKEAADKKQAAEIESRNLKSKKIILNETKRNKQTLLIQTKNQERLYQKSISELEKKQTEIAAEIEKLEEELRLKINPAALPIKRPGVLAMPVQGNLSQGYGATKFARYGYRGKWHNGIDIAAPIGTPVVAAEKGRVIAVDDQDRYCYRGAYGKFIVIEHENNLTTLYAHLSLQVVKKGDIVKRDQLIGYVGRTGYATGPHLHFTVYASQTFRFGPSRVCGPQMPYGGDLNPLDYL